MKFEALVKQLANRINQPHVIEHYLKMVWRTAVKETEKKQLHIPVVSQRSELLKVLSKRIAKTYELNEAGVLKHMEDELKNL